jgi:hypothetical protein
MYFLLAKFVINADGDVVHPGHTLLHVEQVLQMYMDYGIDTFQCLYGEVGMQVNVDSNRDGRFAIIGRTADKYAEIIFAMDYHY